MSDFREMSRQIKQKVLQGSRGLTKFSEDDMDLLAHELTKFTMGDQDWGYLSDLLFLLDHSTQSDRRFESGLLALLKRRDMHKDLLIFTLNASRKHIMGARFKAGIRLDFEFMETIQKLIYHEDPEVVEWVLRTIEETGTQGVYFLKDLDKIKPSPFKLFNKHYRAIREIIALLERRWRQFEK